MEILKQFRAIKKSLRREDRDVGPARRNHRQAERRLARAVKQDRPASIRKGLVEIRNRAYAAWLKEAKEAREAREKLDVFRERNEAAIEAAQEKRCNARLAAILDIGELVMNVASAGSPKAAVDVGIRMVLDHPDIPISEENRSQATALVEAMIMPDGARVVRGEE